MTQGFHFIKYYVLAAINIFLLQVQFWQWFDDGLKRISVIAGIVLTVITIYKIITDVRNKRIDVKMKQLELRRKEEELRRFFEQKYN